MTKLQISAVVVVVAIVATALLIWQHGKYGRLTQENTVLREASEQLRQENQRLVEALKSSTALSEADLRDLMRLRAQATQMLQAEQENAQLKAERDSMAKQASNEASVATNTTLSSPTNEQARRMAGINFAKFLALGCFMYADRHDGQMPTDLAALDPDLRYKSDEQSPSYLNSDWASAVEILYGIRADQFEFTLQGALHQVKNPAEVILMKEKQPTERSDGKFEKVYVFCDGHVQLYATSDGNFDAWEKQHMPSEVPAPTSPMP